jgi:triacylglycerol lipase
LATQLASLGRVITPQMIQGTRDLYVPLHARTSEEGVTILRDIRYGSHPRHRLDLFVPAAAKASEPLPVMVFVHGGGFVAGDKSTPDSPFYDNVGKWAASQGYIGVTMTYRLAPEFPWPSGSDDVQGALDWLREHIGAHGGSTERIVLMGQSAGAVHVAGCLARAGSSNAAAPMAAILISGLYDPCTMERNPLFQAYFGADGGSAAAAPFLENLAATPVPLLLVVAQWDPEDFLNQALVLLKAYLQKRRELPRIYQSCGDNHISTVLQLNSRDDRLGTILLDFAAAVQATPPPPR